MPYHHLKILLLLVLTSSMCFAQTITHPASGTSAQTITCGSTYNYYDSGGSGSNYANGETGILRFDPSVVGQFISIDFTAGAFDVEPNGGGCYDYINIYDGTSTGAPLIGSFCNSNLPGVVTSSSGSLTVEFISDGFVTRSGWDATVTCSATPGSIIHPSSGTFSQTITCGTTYNYYDSGGSAGNYGNSELGVITFNPSVAGQMIQIDFTNGPFDVEPNGGGCYDWIKIYDGTTTGAPLIGTYCNSNVPTTVQSTTGSLTVEFDSDGFTVGSGWDALVSCYSPCSVASGTASASPTLLCGTGTILSLAGEDPSATIQWQVSTNGGVTWTNIPGATTDPYVHSPGVNSMYQALVTNGCTSTSNAVSVTISCDILHPSGSLTSSNQTINCGSTYNYYDENGSGSNYSSNTNSIITICPSTVGQYVSVNFTSFSVESNFDYMYAFDGNDGSANLIGVYTGTSLNGTTITASSANTSGCLSFRFISDGATTSSGWAATVTCTSTPASPYASHGIEDCNGAVVICSNSALVGGTTGPGMQELEYDAFANCIYEPGEAESQWYVFSSITNGTIGFEIVPNSPTDYDWAIWGPYSQLECPIFTGDHSIRCNASSLLNSGPNGETGLVAPANDTIEENGTWAGEVTDGDCRPLDVLAGEIYIMMLDNWSASSVGFQLNWNLTNGATLDCTPPLPITLSSMETTCDGNQTLLTWTTESEINNRLFIIEKADEDFMFKEIGKVMGSGTTNYTQMYEFLDPEVNAKTAYYRLVQVDYDGSVEYHRIVASNCQATGFEVINSTLNNSNLNVLISTSTNELVTVNLYNTTGKLVGTKHIELNAGNNQVSLNHLNISQGIYMLSIIGEYNNYSTKLFGN